MMLLGALISYGHLFTDQPFCACGEGQGQVGLPGPHSSTCSNPQYGDMVSGA